MLGFTNFMKQNTSNSTIVHKCQNFIGRALTNKLIKILLTIMKNSLKFDYSSQPNINAKIHMYIHRSSCVHKPKAIRGRLFIT